MEIKLNKTAIVTGAASGIGEHIANMLESKLSYRVIRVDKVACLSSADKVFTIDLSCEDEVRQMFKLLGEFDVAVNCAGVPCVRKELIAFSSDELMENIAENINIYFNSMKHELLKLNEHKKKGVIINIASITAHFGLEKFSAYSSAKAAIINLTKVAAHEHAKRGIRVNSISPSTIDTPWIRRKYNGKIRDYSKVFHTGYCGTVEDVFSVVEMIINNSFLTGADIRLDGGMSDLLSI